jgi:DNA mismatch endonuclease (patch repair protein)
MSRISGSGNEATELALAKLFRLHGITGWRRDQRVFGRPDFVFPKLKLAIFTDGCFWHSCPKHATRPKSNREYWDRKLAGNKLRDRLVTRTLRLAGWRVVRIWQHELKSEREYRLLRRLERTFTQP